MITVELLEAKLQLGTELQPGL